jgi:LPLT family lysophospholipid transporter-like MFS transporter
MHATDATAPSTSRGLTAVLGAQFLSALGDNALLFAAIAMLRAGHAPSWETPLLQAAFVIAFIVLAPFVGSFADGRPKGLVMLFANGIKFAGTAAMIAGLHPLAAYALVGVGAAAYSPAKYGILSEMVGPGRLVKANGMMEGSTIVAILLGAVVGGKLADLSVHTALLSVCGCYIAAGVANLWIPRLPPIHPTARHSLARTLRDFGGALATLLRDPDARFSLTGTSIFWGAGSTLRLLLVAWVPVALGIPDLSLPANLSGAVAIGIALGAAAAASLISLAQVNRALLAGVLIGPVILVFAHVTNLYATVAVLMLIGALGGFYVVPLNALLQDRGHRTVGAGHAVAVQNLAENIAMLLLVGLYTLMDRAAFPVVRSATLFGLVVMAGIGLLALRRWRHA